MVYIDLFKCLQNQYYNANIMVKKGCKHSEESKKRISEAKRGLKHSEETRKKISESHKGKKLSPEIIAKRIAARDKLKHSGTTKKKIRAPMSDATRKKISEARKQRGPVSEETRRKLSESHKGKCGDKAPNWQGGLSFEPYCVLFNNEFRERVRNFFGRKCIECGKLEVENDGKRLSVHHVNFDKESCCNNNTPLFACLCTSCHMKTNHNREYYEERYTTLINEKYNGQCYLPKPITTPKAIYSENC